MKKLITVLASAGALALPMFGTTALADHDHNLETPGTIVVDIGNGQTEKCAAAPGGHQFHVHVHLGRPGAFAFTQPNNPVSLIKTQSASC